VSTNFEIIRFIVEYEQGGSERAEYGKKTLPELSNRLTVEFGRGFSHSNLENMSRFYPEYCKTEDQISQTRLGYSLENVNVNGGMLKSYLEKRTSGMSEMISLRLLPRISRTR
jgi:hypothetical protein